MVNQVDVDSEMVATYVCTPQGMTDSKETTDSTSTSLLGKAPSSHHPKARKFSSSSYVPDLFGTAAHCWSSERVCQLVTVRPSPLRGLTGTLPALHLTQSQ